MRTAEVAAWINERHAIYMRKALIVDMQLRQQGPNVYDFSERGAAAWGRTWDEHSWTPAHLTDDPILRAYRFCNVFRELDRVTIWIRENIIEPYADHEHLWFMLAIARTINWQPTLQMLMDRTNTWPSARHHFEPRLMSEALDDWKNIHGQKVYTGAYMIRAESDPNAAWYSWSKQRYIGEIVLGKLWEDRASWGEMFNRVQDEKDLCSEEVWASFQSYTGWGPFMAYQVVVDLQHTRYLRDAPDKQTWAAAGPGTIRGLNRWIDYGPGAPMNQKMALMNLLTLREELHQPGVLAPWVPTPIDLSDVCNICCEFDKYERVRLGEGRPRAMYVPGRGY